MPFQAYNTPAPTTPSTGGFQAYPNATAPIDLESQATQVPDSGSMVNKFFSNLTAPIQGGIKNVGAIAGGVANDFKQGGQNIINDVQKTSLSPDYNPKTQQNIGTTVADIVGQIGKAALSPITQTLGKATSDIADTASNVPQVQNIANSKVGTALTNGAGIAGDKYTTWSQTHPEAAKDLEALGNTAQLALGNEAEPSVTDAAKTGLDTTAEAAKPLIQKAGQVATDLADKTVGKQAVASDIAKTTANASQDALDTVKPKLTPTEQATARASGRGTTTGSLIKTADIAPSAREVEMGKVAQEAGVSSKNTSDVNIQKMKDFQQASAEKIRTGLQQADQTKPLNFDKPQFKGQLGNVMNSIEKPITLVGDSAKIATKFKSAVMKLADTVQPTREGMLNLRQGLDKLINEQLPGNIYTKDTPLGQYMRSTRSALNDYVESKIPDGKLPDGSSFKGELRKQSLLYDAIDNVAEKAPKTGEPSNAIIGRAKNFVTKHPYATMAGGYAAEKAIKAITGFGF